MKALEEKILKEGTVLPGNVLKVNSFLNQNIDTFFLMEMGKEIARLYSDTKIDKVMTIESSGIPLAVATALCLKTPAIFAKKGKTSNISGKILSAHIHSYTHNNDYDAIVTAEFIKKGENILLVDDFLANGAAMNGLIEILKQAEANFAGAAVAIEKGFQKGGDKLREMGYRVESLAIVDSMTDNSLEFRHQS